MTLKNGAASQDMALKNGAEKWRCKSAKNGAASQDMIRTRINGAEKWRYKSGHEAEKWN